MHFISLSRSLRLLAVALFSVSLLGCFVVEEGDGPEEVVDPLFVNVPPPAAVVPAALAVFAETSTAPVLAITSITNSAIFTGNNTVADPASTAIMPVEGCNVLAIDYQDSGQTFGGAVLNFGGADLATGSFDTLHFTIDTSAIAGYDDMTIQMEPPGAAAPGTNVALSSYTPVSTSGNWRTYAIPLADFSATDFAALDNLGFWNVVDAGDSLVFGTLYLDNIYYTASTGNGAGTGGCVGGQLLTNGDFEAGNLSSWSPAANGGTITAVDTQDSGSTWSANVVAGPTNNPALSQVNLAVGTVMTGDLIDVSFDMCGSLSGVGGVVFPAVLSEFGVGIGSDRQTLDTFNDLNMPSVWTRYNYQAIAGANVAGGVSLQFDVVCGGDPTCAANVYFDNVSATIGGGIVPGAASGNTCAGGGPGPGPGPMLVNGDFEADPVDKAPWINAGAVTTNNFYTVDAVNGGNVFDTNLSQVLDITDGEDYVLAFRAKASVGRDIVVGLGDAGAPFDTVLVTPNPTLTTEWQSFSFPLTAVNIDGPASRVLFDLGTVASTVNIDDVTLEVDTGGGGPGPGPSDAVNGDFETGDFTGWTLEPGAGSNPTPGTISIDGTNPGTNPDPGNTSVARLQAAGDATLGSQDVLLSQVALGAGSISPGDTIDVSFDLYGSLSGAGGVVFVELIYLDNMGMETGRDFIDTGAPYAPTMTWMTYTGSKPAGANVDGGVTLQLKASCGPVTGCGVDAYFDNVTYIVTP